jgi:hypothetical protein
MAGAHDKFQSSSRRVATAQPLYFVCLLCCQIKWAKKASAGVFCRKLEAIDLPLEYSDYSAELPGGGGGSIPKACVKDDRTQGI